MLATDILAAAPPGGIIRALGRRDLDIRDASAIEDALATHRPRWVINAAAYTAVDRAETDALTANQVNAEAVEHIGHACARRGIAVLHFSTDYVFSGDASRPYGETDATAPVNAYGRTKLAGEQALQASGARALILRVQWLFGAAGRSFPRTMWQRASSGLPTRVVDDQFGRPTSCADVARTVWALLDRDATGLYHVANAGEASWFDLAAVVFEASGSAMLGRCATSDYPTLARRPRYSVLDTGKLEREHQLRLPDWRDAVDRFVEILRREPSASAV